MTRTSSPQSLVLPDDTHNRVLVGNTHPGDWVNPTPTGRYNLVVLGTGTAGLVSAIGAASLGATVAIVERHLTGGDCLNFGCVPSKALISSARAAAVARSAGASEAWKRLGDEWNRMRLTPGVRTLLRSVLRWRR